MFHVDPIKTGRITQNRIIDNENPTFFEYERKLDKSGFFQDIVFTDASVKEDIISWCQCFDMSSILDKVTDEINANGLG